MTGSNRRHPACKAGALPAELITRELTIISIHKNVLYVKAFFFAHQKMKLPISVPLKEQEFLTTLKKKQIYKQEGG